jgi:hypothetical protein
MHTTRQAVGKFRLAMAPLPKLTLAALLAALALPCAAAPGGASGNCFDCPPETGQASAADAWTAVDSGRLAAMRGGFVTPAGLEVSLGIERLVMLNGSIVARNSVEIADVGRLSAEQAQQARMALSSVNVVQNGPENMMMAAPGGAVPGATFIQNSLANQQIDSRTTIHSSVNSVGLLTSLNFQGSLGDAIARATLSR